MQIFKAFYKSVWRHKRALLIYFGIFTVLSILITTLMDKNTESMFTASKVDITVFDYDHSELSEALCDYLSDTQSVISIPDDNEKIADELFYGNVEYVLRIQEGFNHDLTLLENVKKPGSTQGIFLDSSIDQYLKVLATYLDSGYTAKEAAALTRDSLDKTVDVTIPTEASTNTDVDYTGEFFKYLPYVFICMLLTSLGLILGIFREKNLNTRIQCSSMSITKRNLYLTLASISFSLLIWLVFVVISAFVFNDSLFTIHGVLYLVNSLTGILFALSLTYFLSFISTSETVLNMFANIFGLGLSFLGGVFVPLDFLSDGVKNVSRFLPTYWYVLNNDLAEVYTGAAGQLRTFFSYIGIQMLFSVALLLGALALSKIRKNA